MLYIKSYSELLEAEKPLKPGEMEFMSELEKFPLKNIFKSWFTVTPRKTGRISISGGNLPSVSYFQQNSAGEWFKQYEAAGRIYGNKYGNLQDLFMEVIKDSIRKGAPSYLIKKELDEVLADDDWISANVELEPKSIYSKIKSKVIGNSDIVSDFTVLDFPGIESLQKLGLISEPFKGRMGEISFEILHNNSEKPFWLLLDKIVSEEDPRYYTRLSNIESMTFYPKGTGISARSASKNRMQIDLGAKTEKEAVQMIEKSVRKYMSKNRLIIEGDISTETRNFLDSLYKEFIEPSIDGDALNKTMDNYFKTHPLDLWILDSVPHVKAGVLKRTGLRDLSSLGRNINLII